MCTCTHTREPSDLPMIIGHSGFSETPGEDGRTAGEGREEGGGSLLSVEGF